MTFFNKALTEYSTHHSLYGINDTRIKQLTRLTEVLNKHFPFDIVNSVETGGSHTWGDGMVGYYFAHLSYLTQGKFSSVDINPDIQNKVYKSYFKLNPNLQITHTTQDSVSFLSQLPYTPNLVHLDSWDVNLKNPFPSALHGWKEFEAIKWQMPVGSIITIDDNWYKGEWVMWDTYREGIKIKEEKITINYPCVGKGAHIYQSIISGNEDWKILDKKYKLVIQKIKK